MWLKLGHGASRNMPGDGEATEERGGLREGAGPPALPLSPVSSRNSLYKRRSPFVGIPPSRLLPRPRVRSADTTCRLNLSALPMTKMSRLKSKASGQEVTKAVEGLSEPPPLPYVVLSVSIDLIPRSVRSGPLA